MLRIKHLLRALRLSQAVGGREPELSPAPTGWSREDQAAADRRRELNRSRANPKDPQRETGEDQ